MVGATQDLKFQDANTAGSTRFSQRRPAETLASAIAVRLSNPQPPP